MRAPTDKEIGAVGAITFTRHQQFPRHLAEAACKAFIAVSGTPGSSDIFCPFCDEGDFDLPGLKCHIDAMGCKQYEDITI